MSTREEDSDKPAERWFLPIVQFYRQIEAAFSKEWNHKCKQVAHPYEWPMGNEPQFWKSVGDEVIYTKELTDHREAMICLQSWIAAVNSYRGEFKNRYVSLDLKSSAWIAGFPVHNSEVFFHRTVNSADVDSISDDPIYSNAELSGIYYDSGAENSVIRDFIGPSIDTGFRLGSLATPRKLIISIDLALLLIHATRAQPEDFEYPKLNFRYDGRVSLKGVFGGIPYPIFWLDMQSDNSLNMTEDDLRGEKAIDSDRVKAFCEAFISENPKFLFRPYINENPDKFFASKPNGNYSPPCYASIGPIWYAALV
jgi:hypothetical protein